MMCARCGCNVGWWWHGWKHQRGWHSPPSCERAPLPVDRPDQGPTAGMRDGPGTNPGWP